MVLHYEDVMLKEIERRFGYTERELHTAWYYEIEDIIASKDIHVVLNERLAGFGVRFFHHCEELDASETEYFWHLYDSKTEAGVTEAKGIVASKGQTSKIVGKVRIVLDPSQVGEFQAGEILLAPMTSPEYVFTMKKSIAIVTDTGGLTSHAAIVSRELNVPCLVGTKNATKIFKDGDLVEVDAERGIVKKI
jgi:phosphohistidine swiveling domain-containing protein